jgi:methylated-DNA-[protein]-cysteine S-methyltransferase
MQKVIKYTIFKTKWGYFGLAGTEKAFCRTYLPTPEPEVIKSYLMKDLLLYNRASSIGDRVSGIEFDESFIRTARDQITAYFEGVHVDFSNIPIILDGFTLFARSVLKACRSIEFGCTVTYSRLARKAGRSNAARAVGGVMARNPLPLIIPCHRVIRSDGKIGGFSAPGGTDFKEKLLRHEQALLID